jgi:hypothetical protein
VPNFFPFSLSQNAEKITQPKYASDFPPPVSTFKISQISLLLLLSMISGIKQTMKNIWNRRHLSFLLPDFACDA